MRAGRMVFPMVKRFGLAPAFRMEPFHGYSSAQRGLIIFVAAKSRESRKKRLCFEPCVHSCGYGFY
jgi:hypothetical protein